MFNPTLAFNEMVKFDILNVGAGMHWSKFVTRQHPGNTAPYNFPTEDQYNKWKQSKNIK